jgi:hypothetical protein
MQDFKFLVFVTAHDPLSRFDALLKTLRGYEEIPGVKDVFIYIDAQHEHDKETLQQLLEPNVKFNALNVVVASEVYEGFSLTWAHKGLFYEAVRNSYYDFYVYTENDIVFNSENFLYWFFYKNKLRKLNLEPGFCRYESYKSKLVPFDNHRVWQLNSDTLDVWGTRPYRVESYLTPFEKFVGFVSLGNPYMGMMILDQEMAERYVRSQSFDPIKSFELTQFRCWPLADRSSMGLAFEGLLPGQEHRRVVPVVQSGQSIQIAPCGLVEHCDTKYSEELERQLGSVLDISEMFGYASA